VGNKPKQQVKDRRARVEEMRRQQKAAERKKSMLLIGTAVVIALAIIAVPVWLEFDRRRNDPAKQSIDSFGVSASEASCDPVVDDPANGESDHVQPGTKLTYATVPPSSGQHWPVPAAVGERGFYTTKDRPQIEELVHNLEHGYTVLWYSPNLEGEQLEEIEGLATRLSGDRTYRKFIASAWDESYGAFPAGKTIALSHWTRGTGHRQFCGQLAGSAVESFMKTYPASDSPEPNAA
jgi:hypothetical protein